MKIKIYDAEDQREINIRLPLWLLKGGLVQLIIKSALKNEKKAKRKQILKEERARIVDGGELSKNENLPVSLGNLPAKKQAGNELAARPEISVGKLVRVAYKELKRHKGLVLVDIHDAGGDTVQIIV